MLAMIHEIVEKLLNIPSGNAKHKERHATAAKTSLTRPQRLWMPATLVKCTRYWLNTFLTVSN